MRYQTTPGNNLNIHPLNTNTMKAISYQTVNRGLGGYCEQYNIDSLEVRNVVVAVRFTHWSDESRKPYYEIPVSEKNQNAVIAAFPELDIKEAEPGAILLYGCDDETAVKVGMFAAELDGDLNPEPETPNNPETTDTMNTNTPAAMNETNTVEFSDLSHAGQCLDIYLHNTAEIYERYTVPAIATAVEAKRYNERSNARIDDETAWSNLTFWISWQPVIKKALQAAVKLVKKYDHMTPTAKDIEQVTRNYAAYIVECAKYEIENA